MFTPTSVVFRLYKNQSHDRMKSYFMGAIDKIYGNFIANKKNT